MGIREQEALVASYSDEALCLLAMAVSSLLKIQYDKPQSEWNDSRKRFFQTHYHPSLGCWVDIIPRIGYGREKPIGSERVHHLFFYGITDMTGQEPRQEIIPSDDRGLPVLPAWAREKLIEHYVTPFLLGGNRNEVNKNDLMEVLKNENRISQARRIALSKAQLRIDELEAEIENLKNQTKKEGQ